MVTKLSDILETIEALWPESGKESWDAVGLVAGDPEATVERLHLAVDAVPATADEAIVLGANVLLTHHPLLLRGVTSVAENRYKGAVIAKLIRGGCALIAAHTNADVVETGTSAVLAQTLGLVDTAPIEPDPARPTRGLGIVGNLPEPTTLGALARALARILPATASGVRGSGEYDRQVQRIAVCGGAGDSFLAHPAVVGADVYVTSDLRHHPSSEAREQAMLSGGTPCLIDISHWASEWLWLDTAAAELRERHPGLTVTVSDLRTDAWDFVIPQ